MFFTYILQSTINGSFYVGQTQNLFKRWKDHNSGKSKSTKKLAPYNLVWYTYFNSRAEAYSLEKKIKSFKSRKRIVLLINENPCDPGAENLKISDLIDFRASS